MKLVVVGAVWRAGDGVLRRVSPLPTGCVPSTALVRSRSLDGARTTVGVWAPPFDAGPSGRAHMLPIAVPQLARKGG